MRYDLINSNCNKNLFETIFQNRGINAENIEHYLNVSKSDIYSPNLLKNIEKGAKLLVKHIANDSNIFIQVDSDCDGFTSAALLINYLNSLFPHFVQTHIYYDLHDGKEHGIDLTKIPDNIQLVIAPDSSSSDYEEHKILKEKGIDVLVLDHHEAERESENAIVINNQLCDYPNKTLSGVGVVYKFCNYIDSILNINNSENFIDLVAIGMVADMMDLKNYETRYFINTGCEQITNPFFEKLIADQNYSISRAGGLNPFSISFYVAPLINAMNRSGTQDEKKLLFEAMLTFKAYEELESTKLGAKGQIETRVEQACRVCKNVKSRQERLKTNTIEKIENKIENEGLLNHSILILKTELNEEKIPPSLAGLIANELANKYQKPTLVLNSNQYENYLCYEGSARGYEESGFLNFKTFLSNTKLFTFTEGHQNAFGCGIKSHLLNAFVDYSDKALATYDFSPNYFVDAIIPYPQLNPQDILSIGSLNYLWGQGLKKPIFAITNFTISNDTNVPTLLAKGPTLKIQTDNGITLIKFKFSEEEFEKLNIKTGCIQLTIIGSFEINSFNGIETPQITILDYEITNIKKYYF